MAKAWYIVHTYSGYEQKIQRTIFKLREMDTDFALVVSDVKVPMETVTEIKDGKKKEVKRKILPGYILVEIDFPDDAPGRTPTRRSRGSRVSPDSCRRWRAASPSR